MVGSDTFWGCVSSKNGDRGFTPEFCPGGWFDGWFRKKRSLTEDNSEAAYAGGRYDHLMDRAAMEKFLNFDLNKDGQISREFKQVDENNDGFVQPGELDISLK